MGQGSWWGSKDKTVTVGPTPAYKVLQADLVRGSEKERAAAIGSFVLTSEDAYKLAGHEGFQYRDLDTRGRVGVVCLNGVETRLLFKRHVVQITPGPADPVPERTLKEPAEAWIQIDLLNTDDAVQQKGIGEKLRQSLAQNGRLRDLWKAEEAERIKLEERLETLEKAGEQLTAANEKNLLLEANIRGALLDIESLKRDLTLEKEGRRTDKRKMMEEIFPVFNTVWLAGVYRVEDQLYSILKKQMMDALSCIGISLIEPKVGELFNPSMHHAVHSHEFEEGAQEIDCVTQVHGVGWRLGSLVMKAAEVTVGTEKRSTDRNENATVDQEQQG